MEIHLHCTQLPIGNYEQTEFHLVFVERFSLGKLSVAFLKKVYLAGG